MKKQKLEVIVITGHELTKEERKNYKRDHPGYPGLPIISWRRSRCAQRDSAIIETTSDISAITTEIHHL